MANHFFETFSTVISSEFLLNSYPIQHCNNKFTFSDYSSDIFQIENILAELKFYSSSGLNHIPSIFSKKYASSVSYLQLLLFKKISFTNACPFTLER